MGNTVVLQSNNWSGAELSAPVLQLLHSLYRVELTGVEQTGPTHEPARSENPQSRAGDCGVPERCRSDGEPGSDNVAWSRYIHSGSFLDIPNQWAFSDPGFRQLVTKNSQGSAAASFTNQECKYGRH